MGMLNQRNDAHWYSQKGEPWHTITGADGEERPTTLRDARRLNLVPSVTTVQKIKARDGLERWFREQMLLSALTLPKRPDESLDDYAKRVSEDAWEQVRKAGERGNAIHAALEDFTRTGKPTGYSVECLAVHEAIQARYPGVQIDPERTFCHPNGFGGQVDASDPLWGRTCGWIGDYKSKEFHLVGKKPHKKLWWPDMAAQLGAYRQGIGLPRAICCNIFVSVTSPGDVYIHEWPEEEIRRQTKIFHHLLEVWKLEKKYNPSIKEVAS